MPAQSLIHVRACRPTDTFFAGILGASSPTVCREETARRQNEIDMAKLPALIAEEQKAQVELEKRLGQALETAREAMQTEGINELRSAFDAVRAWGHSLAFEARRFKPKPS